MSDAERIAVLEGALRWCRSQLDAALSGALPVPTPAETELRDIAERAVRLLEMIDAPVERSHDARVTAMTWLAEIRPEIVRLRTALSKEEQ